MSKKIVNDSSLIVFDVKAGSGALNKNLTEAKLLSKSLIKVANKYKRDVVTFMTDMNQPLGIHVGNAGEIQEAIDTLLGKGPEDIRKLSVLMAAKFLENFKKISEKEAIKQVEATIENGRAYKSFLNWIQIQGAKIEKIDFKNFYKPKKENIYPIKATKDGYVNWINAAYIQLLVINLGGGRTDLKAKIDHQVGMNIFKKQAEAVKKGEVVAEFIFNPKRTNQIQLEEMAKEYFKKAINIVSKKPKVTKLIMGVEQNF